MKSLVAALERTPVGIAGFFAAFTGIVLVRCFIESLASATASGYPPVDPYTLLHYALFYLLAYIALALVIGAFCRTYARPAKLLLFGLVFIWIGPLLDLLLSGPLASVVTYLFHAPGALLGDFFSFFGPLSRMGVTLGIRIELLAAFLTIGWYVRLHTGSMRRGALAALASYAAIFILFALPTLLYAVAGGTTMEGIAPFYASLVEGSKLPLNALPGTLIPSSPNSALELGFNKLLSLVFMIGIVPLGALLFYRIRPRAFLAHARNVRAMRALMYLLFLGIGAAIASVALGWMDMLGLLVLAIAWVAAWMFSVCVNDIVDVPIDAISSPERPLVSGALSVEDMREGALLFLALALVAGMCAGYYPLFFLLVFLASYYLYSAPPLRLKRVPVLSSFLIGIAASVSVLAGYIAVSPDAAMGTYPLGIVMGICISVTLAANLRDLKDLAGDEAAGIHTLALLLRRKYGERAAFRIIGMLAALALALSGFFLQLPFLLLFALGAAAAAYWFITRMPYSERPVFLVALAYLAIVGASLLLA